RRSSTHIYTLSLHDALPIFEVDRAYLKSSGGQGIYPLMYFSHNIHFLAFARAAQGRFADAKKAADDLVAFVGPHVDDMPMLEGLDRKSTRLNSSHVKISYAV